MHCGILLFYKPAGPIPSVYTSEQIQARLRRDCGPTAASHRTIDRKTRRCQCCSGMDSVNAVQMRRQLAPVSPRRHNAASVSPRLKVVGRQCSILPMLTLDGTIAGLLKGGTVTCLLRPILCSGVHVPPVLFAAQLPQALTSCRRRGSCDHATAASLLGGARLKSWRSPHLYRASAPVLAQTHLGLNGHSSGAASQPAISCRSLGHHSRHPGGLTTLAAEKWLSGRQSKICAGALGLRTSTLGQMISCLTRPSIRKTW